jgi:hypothetical protein
VEITGEEGGVSQSNIFPVVAQEEKRGTTRDARSWDWELQIIITKLGQLSVNVDYLIYCERNCVILVVNEGGLC